MEENGKLEILNSLHIGSQASSMATNLLVLLHTVLTIILVSGILVSYNVSSSALFLMFLSTISPPLYTTSVASKSLFR